jgi:hypothetical protein
MTRSLNDLSKTHAVGAVTIVKGATDKPSGQYLGLIVMSNRLAIA